MDDTSLKYSDYLEVSEKYSPVVSPESIRSLDLRWTDTFPHETIIRLIGMMERMLSRDKVDDRKGIWIEGSYGTGKSQTIWMLDNLLRCTPEELKAYFSRYEDLEAKQDLRQKLLAHKRERIVTAFRYFDEGIQTEGDLVLAVFDSVTASLKEAGLDYKDSHTLRGRICEWLDDKGNADYFEYVARLPKNSAMLPALRDKSADEVAAILRSGAQASELVDQILTLGRLAGVQPFRIGMTQLGDWIKEVTEANHLKAIVLFWDEFSTFFASNRGALAPFQQLAEMSVSTPFYLVIATHVSSALASPTEMSDRTASFRVTYDRFMHATIEMPDDIAFRLIADALRIKPTVRAEYEDLRTQLSKLLDQPREAVSRITKSSSDKVLQGLFPIHPMTALLLKHIATSFASNQRSMFNYIKNPDSERLHAFQWFIRTHSPDKEDILTIDYLWNFFYEQGPDDYAPGIGRANLDAAVAGILDMYPTYESRLKGKNERRVLKTILMMQAMSHKLAGQVPLLRPTEDNLRLAFTGDPQLDGGMAVSIAHDLARRKLVHEDTTGKATEFVVAAQAGDQVQMEEIQNRLRGALRTAKLLSEGEIENVYDFPTSIRKRYLVGHATVDDFYQVAGRLAQQGRVPVIPAVFCYARSEEERTKMRGMLDNAQKQDTYADIVFIDVTGSTMAAEDVEAYVRSSAESEFWRGNRDAHLADMHQRKARAFAYQWRDQIGHGSFVIRRKDAPAVKADGVLSLAQALDRTTQQIYPLSLDNPSLRQNMYTSNQIQSMAQHALSGEYGSSKSEEEMMGIVLGKAMHDPAYWEEGRYFSSPEATLAQLKRSLDSFIERELASNVRVSMQDIYGFLASKGFTATPLYAAVAGFLLRDYAKDPYCYSDGNTGGTMTAERMGGMIHRYVKYMQRPSGAYKPEYLQRMTPNQKAFVDFAGSTFGLRGSQSVEKVASDMRNEIRRLQCPLWVLSGEEQDDERAESVHLLSNVLNTRTGVSEAAERLGQRLRDDDAAADLGRLLTREEGTRALRDLLRGYRDGAVLQAAAEAGVSEPDTIERAREAITSGDSYWLWDKKTGFEELDKLAVRFRIMALSQRLSAPASTFAGCMSKWQEYALIALRVPEPVLEKHLPDLKAFLAMLRTIAQRGELPATQHEAFLSQLEAGLDAISALPDQMVRVLAEAYPDELEGLDEEDIRKLYNKMDKSAFLQDRHAYGDKISGLAATLRCEQRHVQLQQEWKRRTGTASSDDWSRKNATPISAMVPSSEERQARNLFDALDRHVTSESLEAALAYLRTSPGFLDRLAEKASVEQAFSKAIVNPFGAILRDNDEVRRDLLASFPNISPSDWAASGAVQERVHALAEDAYRTTESQRLLERIDEMDPERAKRWLKQLAADNLLLGASILAEDEKGQGEP